MDITLNNENFSGILIYKDKAKEIFLLKPYHKNTFLILESNTKKVTSNINRLPI